MSIASMGQTYSDWKKSISISAQHQELQAILKAEEKYENNLVREAKKEELNVLKQQLAVLKAEEKLQKEQRLRERCQKKGSNGMSICWQTW